MTKKVSLQYKIHLEYMYIQVVLYLLSRLQSWCSKFHHWKWTTNFKGSILFSLDKLQWNKKKLIFKANTDVYLANSKWTVQDKSFKWKLKLLRYNNLIFGHCCCLSHRIHLVSTIEMQQHLNKINSRIHVKISCRIFDPSLNNKTTVLMMQTTQKDITFKNNRFIN